MSYKSLPLQELADTSQLLELQSLPRVSRHSLSLPRASSEHSINRRPAGSHAALFAEARALSGSVGGSVGSTGSLARSGSAKVGSAETGAKRAVLRPVPVPQNTVSQSGTPPIAPSATKPIALSAATGYPPSAAPSGTAASVTSPTAGKAGSVKSAPNGVSAAFMFSYLSKNGPPPDASPKNALEAEVSPPDRTTRAAAQALKRRMKEANETGPYADSLTTQTHPVTCGVLAGRAEVYVAHAWDSDFGEMVAALVSASQGDLDKCYIVDMFSADLQSPPQDPVNTVMNHVAGADMVLMLIDGEGEALRRLWVIFEALTALQADKLQIRCTAPGGFGASEAALKAWEARIDKTDWALAETSRKSDEKRLRAFAEKGWEVNHNNKSAGGKGVERMLAQLRKALRQEVYSQILIAAIEKGDKNAVRAALDLGADPEVQDALGNTGEALAAYNGRDDIENLLFERRMRQHCHPGLSDWALDPRELANSDQARWFVTEYLGGEGVDVQEARDSDEEHLIAGDLLRLSEVSTATPTLSSRAESQNASNSAR